MCLLSLDACDGGALVFNQVTRRNPSFNYMSADQSFFSCKECGFIQEIRKENCLKLVSW